MRQKCHLSESLESNSDSCMSIHEFFLLYHYSGGIPLFYFWLLYLLSNKLLLYDLMILFDRLFNNYTSLLHKVHTNLTYICIIYNLYIYISCTRYSTHLIFRLSFQNCWNFSPCNSLVINYLFVASVGQYLIVKFTFSGWYMRG